VKEKVTLSVLSALIFAWFCLAEAQQVTKALPRIGFISSTGAPGVSSPLFDAFQAGLRHLGYVEGKNIVIERRYAEDVILAVNNVVIRAAKEATKTIPIVMISSVDPVAAGYVESFAQPGRNITGFAWLNRDISAKRVELLQEMLPKISRLGVLWDVDGPGPAVAVKEYEAAARAFKFEFRSLQVRGPNPDFAQAFHAAKTARVNELIVVGNPLMSQNAKQIFELAG
jgi:putative ABC transport system substrate-binding protein